MGASKKIKAILLDEDLTQIDLAERTGKQKQTLYNMLQRDTMSYKTVEEFADALGCDVIFRNRKTGKIYD